MRIHLSALSILFAALTLTLTAKASEREQTNCFSGDQRFSTARQNLAPWFEYASATIQKHQDADLALLWHEPLKARIVDAVNSRLDVERAIFCYGVDKNGQIMDLNLSLSTGRPDVDQKLKESILHSAPFVPPESDAVSSTNYGVVTSFRNDGKNISVSSDLGRVNRSLL